MPRALWTGSLSFGLVNVPVQMLSAVRDVDVHFHQLHAKDAAPIDTRRFCVEEDREVDYAEIGHGYEIDDGKQVVLTDEELASVQPEKTRTIDISEFVDARDVDPIYFAHPYWLVPVGQGEGPLRAYRLLVDAMSQTERIALGRVVLRTKEYLVAVRVRDGRLALTTMLFGDEVRPTEEIEPGGREPAEQEVELMRHLIDQLTEPFEHASFEDRYRQRLREVIARKRRGQTIKAPEQTEAPGPPDDVLAALQRSLREIRAADDGDGAPDAPERAGRFDREDLEDLSRGELYERAKDADVSGRSSMTKDELVEALSGAG
jgi:DNA end-binding protein Ku